MKNMKCAAALLSGCLALLPAALSAQERQEPPRLVVGITVDRLNLDYLSSFSHLFGEDGFNRLMREGRLYENATYDFDNLDAASSVAALYSGTVPFVNGIIGERWKERSTLRVASCVDDSGYKGWYTNDCSSPAKLKVTTIADELKVATAGKSIVCSVAPDREAAVLAAGHAADWALWKNDITGNWCGTDYYGAPPTWVNIFNKVLARSLTNPSIPDWEPLPGTERYDALGFGTVEPFVHSFSAAKGFREYKTTPLINDEVKQLVEYALKNVPLGQDAYPDLLSVGLYAGNYRNQSPYEAPVEIQDIYVRLDREIARLVELCEQKAGKGRVLLFVASTGYADRPTQLGGHYRLPGGELHLDRVTALLNVYLNAIFGRNDLVDDYYNTEIYLDQKLIEKRQLNLQDVISRAADFLVQVEGVRDVFSVNELNGVMSGESLRVRNGFNRLCSGDLSLQLQPGWSVAADDYGNAAYFQRQVLPSVPLLFWGAGVKQAVVPTPQPLGALASTLARLLHVGVPNACSELPMRLGE